MYVEIHRININNDACFGAEFKQSDAFFFLCWAFYWFALGFHVFLLPLLGDLRSVLRKSPMSSYSIFRIYGNFLVTENTLLTTL